MTYNTHFIIRYMTQICKADRKCLSEMVNTDKLELLGRVQT